MTGSEIVLGREHHSACIAIVTVHFLYLEVAILNAEIDAFHWTPLVVNESVGVGFVFATHGQTIIDSVVPIHSRETIDSVECTRACFDAGAQVSAVAGNGFYVAVGVHIGIFTIVVGARAPQVAVGAVGIVDVPLNAERIGYVELGRTEDSKA